MVRIRRKFNMIYRLAKETDVDKICSLVESAVRKMEI